MVHKKLNRRLKSLVEISAAIEAGGSRFVYRRHRMFHVAGTFGDVSELGARAGQTTNHPGQVVSRT